MRSGFNNRQSAIDNRQFPQPFSKLICQQFAEETACADAGYKVAPLAYNVLFCLVITSFRTIKGQFHETRERNCTTLKNFFTNDGGGHFHCLQGSMSLIRVAAT